MGKKIKGKKHRTVRYPEQQKRLRELKIYHKTNNPPKVIDDQEIPKGVRKIAEFKEKIQSLEEKYERKQMLKKDRIKAKKAKTKDDKIDRHNLLETLLVKENPLEEIIVINDVRPIKRKHEAPPQPAIKPSHPPVKKTIQAEIKRSKEKNKQLLTELSNEYPNFSRFNKVETGPKKSKKLSKKQKNKLKDKVKHDLEEEESEMFEPVYDEVKFGEVVHAPPKFKKRPRNTQVENKPGKRGTLLLTSMLNPNADHQESTKVAAKFDYSPNFKGKKNYKPDLTGKRKDLSIADRRRVEKEQAIAIAAYKKIKAEKWKSVQGN